MQRLLVFFNVLETGTNQLALVSLEVAQTRIYCISCYIAYPLTIYCTFWKTSDNYNSYKDLKSIRLYKNITNIDMYNVM